MKQHLNYPEYSLYAFLEERSANRHDAAALEYFGKRTSYGQLLAEIRDCAAALQACGIGKGDAVSLCLPNLPQTVTAFYAANCIGAAANMIHPMSAPAEILHYLTLTQSRILFVLDLVWEQVRPILPQTQVETVVLVSAAQGMPFWMRTAYRLKNRKSQPKSEHAMQWQQFLAKKQDLQVCRGDAMDLAAILYSGGTTGKPKGVMLSNRNCNALALQSIEICGCLQAGDRVLAVMPMFHGFGLGVCIHTTLCFGGIAVLRPTFSVKTFDRLLWQCKPNVIAGVPAIYEQLIRTDALQGKDLSFLRCVISGGDALSQVTKQRMNWFLAGRHCTATVREGYGLTECVTGSCLMPEGSENLASVGLPYPDTTYRILDPASGAVLPAGQIGEIVLSGPTVMLGYLHEPEETAQTLRTDADGTCWLHTGDLGSMDAEGYVYFHGRRKRMIVSGGYNIYPQNLEAQLQAQQGVQQCVVVGMPDPVMGQRVRAYIVPKAGAEPEQLEAALRAACRQAFARYEQPREYVFLKTLPRTRVGKIAYTELMQRGEGDDAGEEAFSAGASGNITHKV